MRCRVIQCSSPLILRKAGVPDSAIQVRRLHHLFMVVWAGLNTFIGTWDPYPFILLNLFLSMLAGLQGAILLIAAKRQDRISAALAQHDFDTNEAAKIDIEALLEINNRQLLMLGELQFLLRAGTVGTETRTLSVRP